MNNKPTPSDAHLVKAFQQGSSDALTQLHERYAGVILQFLHYRNNDQTHVDDINQNTWIRVMNKINSLHDPDKFKSWLYRIAHRESLQFFRQHKNTIEESGTVESNDESPLIWLINQEQTEQLQAALHKIPSHAREIIWLVMFEGYSHAEAGRILDIPTGTARSRLHYAIRALQQEMKHHV